MTAISVEIDNEWFMVKVERNSFKATSTISILSPDQQIVLYSETISFGNSCFSQQFELDFDKRDAKKIVRRYLRFRKE